MGSSLLFVVCSATCYSSWAFLLFLVVVAVVTVVASLLCVLTIDTVEIGAGGDVWRQWRCLFLAVAAASVAYALLLQQEQLQRNYRPQSTATTSHGNQRSCPATRRTEASTAESNNNDDDNDNDNNNNKKSNDDQNPPKTSFITNNKTSHGFRAPLLKVCVSD